MEKTVFIILAIVVAVINVVKILVPLFSSTGATTGAAGSAEWWQTTESDYAYQQMVNQQMFDEQNRLFDEQNQQFIDQHNQWAMEESLKAVTPWEMGGYDLNQGNSFNDFGFGGGCDFGGGFGGGCGMF